EQEKHQAELAAAQAKAGGGQDPYQARERIDCDHYRFSDADASASADRRSRQAKEQSFADRAAEVLETVQQGYLDKLRPLVEEALAADPIAQGKPIEKLNDVAVPGARRYTEFVRAFLWDVLDEGRAALASETGQETAGQPVSNRLRQWINARAEMIASDHLAQLKTAVLGRILTGLRAEMTTGQIFSDAGAAAIEEFNRNTAQGWNLAAAELMSALAEEYSARTN
ncbi:MAG TPA: hypothetical protein VFU47_11620, partial [Armatimonadota bacterium]|nr:hypothetical protein [Armatimonadota bacterium]